MTYSASRRRFVCALAASGAAAACAARAGGPYVCPPCGCASDGVEFDAPGRCPSCGMRLVPKGAIEERPAAPAGGEDAPRTRAAAPSARYEAAAARASDMLAAHRRAIGAPALSAAVAVGGAPVWAEAVGWSDLEAHAPATPDTRFRIGSTSKALTVTVTARLMERGVVDFDAPISRYKDDLPERWRALTLRQLHSHTAGIPGYENNRDYLGLLSSILRWRHYENVADSLDQFDGSSLIYPPGEGFYYSSYDVVLASAVLQAAAGRPFLELLQEEVLDPVGMRATGADYADRDVPNRAVFYDVGRGGARRARRVDLSGRWAAGGLVSTSSDLARLGAAYLHGSLLRPETVQMLWTPQRLATGEVNAQSYALGWRSQRSALPAFGQEVWMTHHGGVSTGAMSWLAVYPDLDLVVAMNANAEARTFGEFNAPQAEIAKAFAEAARA